jgi:ribosome recycling factor
MTTERRQHMAKLVRKDAEDAKIAIRNVRREFNDKVKAMAKDSEISKDEEKKGHDQIQKVTDKWIDEVDKIAQAKEKDVMEE